MIKRFLNEKGEIARHISEFDALHLPGLAVALQELEHMLGQEDAECDVIMEKHGRDIVDADFHYPADTEIVRDFHRLDAIGHNKVFLPIHIGHIKRRILAEVKATYPWVPVDEHA